MNAPLRVPPSTRTPLIRCSPSSGGPPGAALKGWDRRGTADSSLLARRISRRRIVRGHGRADVTNYAWSTRGPEGKRRTRRASVRRPVRRRRRGDLAMETARWKPRRGDRAVEAAPWRPRRGDRAVETAPWRPRRGDRAVEAAPWTPRRGRRAEE